MQSTFPDTFEIGLAIVIVPRFDMHHQDLSPPKNETTSNIRKSQAASFINPKTQPSKPSTATNTAEIFGYFSSLMSQTQSFAGLYPQFPSILTRAA
jgi:hypothetical protein